MDEHLSSGPTELPQEESNIFDKFVGLPKLPGHFSNVILVFREDWKLEHKHEMAMRTVTERDPLRDHCPKYKKFIKELIRHLFENRIDSVQVASNLTGMAESFGKPFLIFQEGMGIKKVSYLATSQVSQDAVEVTLLFFIGVKGQLQHDRLYELVRHAFRTSTRGVIILGPKSIAENTKSLKWQGFLSKYNDLNSHLHLTCEQHDTRSGPVKRHSDLKNFAPLGGCWRVCGEMNCGHVCSFMCHPMDPNHDLFMFKCRELCGQRCKYGHPCQKLCFEDCGPCMYMVPIDRRCPHALPGPQILCHQQENVCMEPLLKALPCGHIVQGPCSQSTIVMDSVCSLEKTDFFPCGHMFTYPCSISPEVLSNAWCNAQLTLQSPCHHKTFTVPCQTYLEMDGYLKCSQPCGCKLQCGHTCIHPCHWTEDPDHTKYKCDQPCQSFCKREAHPCLAQHPCSEPCPPCPGMFPYTLPCSHIIEVPCTSGEDVLEGIKCQEDCLYVYAFCKHRCAKKCGDPCGHCETLVQKKTNGCRMGHTIFAKCGEPLPSRCTVLVKPVRKPDCGHAIYVECYQAGTVSHYDLALKCDAPCAVRFEREGECGHKCQGVCKDCFQGRFHVRCQAGCGKVQICGHVCIAPCGSACPPCPQPCYNECEHSRCPLECGVPCERNCELPCPFKCPHSACTNLCKEVCNKAECNEPCPLQLDCGHPCMGLCGDECPSLCGICDEDDLLVGDFSGSTGVNMEDRYIYLEECGHCVERSGWEQWLNQTTTEILPISCPICNTRAFWIRRYSKRFDENFKLINSVKTKIFGSFGEIEGKLDEAKGKIRAWMDDHCGDKYFPGFIDHVYSEMSPRVAPPSGSIKFKSVTLAKAVQINWACAEWRYASECLEKTHDSLADILFQELRAFMREYITEMITRRPWPLHPNEIVALKTERQRLEDTYNLFSRMCKGESKAVQRLQESAPAEKMFDEIISLIRKEAAYSDELHYQFLVKLKALDEYLKTTLVISESERHEIVLAFGETVGRWFKCANGHIYVVTECGGTTERSVCPECGIVIGGENHRLEERNYFAPEMDGAREPMYLTVLERTYDD